MKNAIRLLGAAAIVAATIAVTTTTAGADAAVTTSTTSCSTFTAEGTTDAAFYVVEVYDEDADEYLLYEAYPADDGTFSFSVSWTPVPEAGTNLSYYVWGSPTDDPDDWDEGEYFDLENVACVADAPTTTTTEPVTPTTPTTAGPAVQAEAVAVTPAFTG